MRRWAPIAAALSVIAVAVAVSLVFGRSSGGEPPKLRLASGGADTAAAADAPMATGKMAASGSSFELAGPLPSGPDEARAHALPRGAAKEDAVRRLAAALGVTGEPRRVERAWQVGSLRVEDAAGNPWSMYVGCGPDQPVSAEAGVSSDGAVSSSSGVSVCAGGGVAVPGAGSTGSSGSGGAGSDSSGAGRASTPNSTTVAPPPPAPEPAVSPCPARARCAKPTLVLPPPPTVAPADVDKARRAANVVLDKLGLSDAVVTAQPVGAQVFVQADPRVDGLRTWGYTTQLQIDAEDLVVGGNGYLGTPSSDASYPLISAAEAFKNLPELPRPMMLCPANADCPQPMPAKVTGAELGLQLTALADDGAALLPAWLFTIEGWPSPLPQAAIEPRFLQLPEPVKVDPGLVDPGQIEPAPPVPASSSGPNVDPAGSHPAFAFDAAYPSDDPNVVIVQYGDSGSCPRTNVTHLVRESADSIVVFLEADALPNQPCTDDYRQVLVTVQLDAPLGNRTVVDGSRDEPVKVDRTCARPMGQPSPPKSCRG